jgi:hypothetical protein
MTIMLYTLGRFTKDPHKQITFDCYPTFAVYFCLSAKLVTRVVGETKILVQLILLNWNASYI